MNLQIHDLFLFDQATISNKRPGSVEQVLPGKVLGDRSAAWHNMNDDLL